MDRRQPDSDWAYYYGAVNIMRAPKPLCVRRSPYACAEAAHAQVGATSLTPFFAK